MNRRRLFIPVIAGAPAPSIATFLLDDQFTDTVAGGGVNGTTATPGGQTRGAVDTTSRMSVAGGVLVQNGFNVKGTDPRIYYGPFTRAQGLGFAFDVIFPVNFVDALIFGWMTDTGTALNKLVNTVYFHSGAGVVNYWNGSSQTSISTDMTVGVQRKFIVILRAAGCYVVQAAADLASYNLIHVATNDSTASLYVGGGNRVTANASHQDNLAIGQLGGGWLSDAYSGASVPLAITGIDKLWLDALC